MSIRIRDLSSISVIVPVRNSAKTIGDLLDSLMGLNYARALAIRGGVQGKCASTGS